MLSSAQRTNTRSLYSRIIRLVVPIIMVTFLIIGLTLLLAIRLQAQQALSQSHHAEVTDLSQDVSDQFQSFGGDLLQIAQGRSARDFARDTLVNIANNTINDSQKRLLGDFTTLLEQHPEYLAIRYVTLTGSVWSEVTNNGSTTPTTNADIRLNVLANDPTLLRSLTVKPGEVVTSDITFQLNPNAPILDRLVPFFRLSTPVEPDTEFASNTAGVIQLDVDATALLKDAQTTASTLLARVPGRQIIIADSGGQILLDTAQPDASLMRDLALKRPLMVQNVYSALQNLVKPDAPLASAQNVNGSVYSTDQLVFSNNPSVFWHFILLDDANQLEGSANALSLAALLLSLVVGMVVSFAVGRVLKNHLRPIGSVNALVGQWVKEGGATPAADLAVASDDEIGQLMIAFKTMSERVDSLKQDIEHQQQRYVRNMALTERISRETITINDINQLLNRAIDLICSEFGYYHAQVFLLDDIGQNAVLSYSHGEIGQKLLEQGHKIPAGSESVIGTVTYTGAPVVINNTTQAGKTGQHMFNPLLPETRSEMALPLQFGDNIIGALDIQSAQPDAFAEDEIRTFQILADQIAVAIQKVRLLTQSDEHIAQIDTLNRQLTHSAWEEASQHSDLDAVYTYDLLNLHDEAIDKPAFSLPIAVRGEVVGSLDALPPEGSAFTEGDHAIMRAVADRVAIAIENVRLFEETQSSLAETFMLYQLSRYLNEADSLEDILQALIVSVMPEATNGQIGVFDEYLPGNQPDWLEIVAEWSMGVDEATRMVELRGMQLRLNEHPILSQMQPNQIALVTDVEQDNRLGSVLHAIVETTSAKAMVFIPFSVRGAWRGVIIVEFPSQRDFNEREGRIYSALIDQAGVAIDNRLLLQQNEMALGEVERLYTGSRMLNMAQTIPDLVMAVIKTSSDPTLSFQLGIFEGDLDETGWPTQSRIIVRSRGEEVFSVDERYTISVEQNSPLRHREPQFLRDINPNAPPPNDMIAYMRTQGFSLLVLIPLFSMNHPLALFGIASHERAELSMGDMEIYRALTGQMSTVLQNRRLLEQTEAALDETKRLYDASRSIAAAADSNAVYQAAALHLAAASVGVTRVSILLAGPSPSIDAPYVSYVHVWSRDDRASAVPLTGAHITSETVPFGQLLAQADGTIRINNTHNMRRSVSQLQTLLERGSSASAVLTAIQSRQRWYGLLLCESDEPNAFDESYVNFNRAIAGQVAIAVESLFAFEEAQLQAQRALALAEAGQLATRMGGQFVESLNEVFTRVSQPAKYDRWLLALVNESENRLEALIENMPQELMGVRGRLTVFDLSSDTNPMAQAYQAQRTIILNTPSNFPDYDQLPPEQQNALGKAIIMPVRLGSQTIGVLLVGKARLEADLDEYDEQLITTLAAQVAIAIENQRLLRSAEDDRERLSSILETLPAGVLVLDSKTYKPLQFNQQVEQMLGRPVSQDQAFDVETYNIYRSGTNTLYPSEELPVFAVTEAKQLLVSDDISVLQDGGARIDLLMNAAPILDDDGDVTAIVASFQDVSTLRNLERTLEGNLRETVALYETTRALSEAAEAEDVIDQMLLQLGSQNASDAYVLLLDEQWQGVRIVNSLSGSTGEWTLPSELLDPRDALFIPDIHDAFSLDDAVRLELIKTGVLAVVALPMRARSRRNAPLGWLVITFSEPQDFTPEREQFLIALNDNATVALDNRYLFQSTEQALQETAALYDATTTLTRARTADEIGQAIQGALVTLTPDMFAAYLATGDGVHELFNVSQDAAPAEFRELLVKHDLMQGQDVFIDDVRSVTEPTPLEQDLITMGNIRSLAVVHLRSQDEASGCFFLAYHHPHRFSSGDSRYLNSIADSASVVVDNFLLLEQIQSSLEETSILYRASRSLNDATTPDQILNAVVGHLSNRSISQVFMALLSTENWEHPKAMAQVVATWQPEGDFSIDLAGINLVAEQYPAWRLLASPHVLTIDDVSEAEELDMMERIGVESLELRSLSILPLRVAGRSIGAIVIGGRTPYHHTDRDQRVYRSLSEQASLRMEATRLLEQTERRARQLTTSSQVSQIASSILELSQLFPRIVDLIRDSFGYDHVQIFMMDDADNYAELRASTGEPGRQLLEIHHKLQKGSVSVIGQVTATGQPTIASDTADARVVHRPNPYLPNTRSEMAIPLTLKGQTVGALDVQSNQPNAFDDDDVTVLQTLASQISVAIDNAQLFQQSSRRANEMSFLFSVTTAAASADNLQDAIQNVANELHESLGALSVSIYLPQQYVDAEESEFTLLEPVAMSGSDQPLSELSEVRLDADDSLIAESARSRRPLIIDNTDLQAKYVPVVGSAKSAIIVPLTSSAELIGLVALESSEWAAYDNDTLTLLLTLSGTLSAIIQNQQLLETVQKTNDQLRELDRLKSDFLANMSHELRTPLNSIIGFSRVILKGIDGSLTEMQEQDLTTIYNSGLHLLNLINDILDQAKIAAGKMDLQFNYFEMKAVIDGVRSIGIGLVKDKPIDIYVDTAPGLPKVYGDEFRTRQVLLNLVSNAAKFTKQGSITISTYPVRDEETGLMMIRTDVTDTGIGIADQDIPLLFEAFRQVDSSLTRTQGGTGLGLPIAKSLMEMQGGRMLVSSVVNAGSTFSITMPVEPVVEEDDTTKKKTGNLAASNGGSATAEDSSKKDITGPLPRPKELEKQSPEAGGAGGGFAHIKRQILLIEDNPDMVDEYRRALQREGFDIFTASIPLEAEAMASGLHPTIIIMDVNFADGQGWDILGKLKARDDTFDIPVIIVTLSDERERAAEMGAFRFIQRPIVPTDLATAVADAEKESRVDRILIIDDQPESVRLLTQVLEQQGQYRIFSAANGADGIALVARRRPNLVILDLRMPEMDGFEVVKELRGNPETATIPILVVTGDTLSSEEREQLLNLAVLHKAEISSDEYRQFMDGVRTYLNGD